VTGLRRCPTSPAIAIPTVLVVFGATGDLMDGKIAPALYHLHERGRLPERFRVVGFARRDLGDEAFRGTVGASVRGHHVRVPDEADLTGFLSGVSFVKGAFEDPEAFSRLAESLRAIDSEWGACSNKLFFLAVPPSDYGPIIGNLAGSGLTAACSAAAGEGGWTCVIVEKPFGSDGRSARGLDASLGTLFEERQIYRIDHYLAKEMLQGIMNFRFSNNLLEPSWSRRAISRIEIDLLETIGVESRGAFYDSVGALRDVGQNHLLQMLALITMARPASSGAEAIRASRAAALEALRPLTPEEVRTSTFRGQYDGYLDIAGVSPGSTTETFFKVATVLQSQEWRGVPVIMRAGKRIDKARKRIISAYAQPEMCLCEGVTGIENRVTFELEPVDSIKIAFWTKKPGFEARLEKRDFDFFLYEKEEKTQYVEEYAKLLSDVFAGDQTLFVSKREVMAMWEFVDPIEAGWAEEGFPLFVYRPGTAEPLAASEIMEQAPSSMPPMLREIGMVGLGKMGSGLTLNLVDHDWRVVGFDRTPAVADALASEAVEPAHTLAELVAQLEPPRVVWLMVPAGDPVDQVLFGEGGLAAALQDGDTVIDGGNSHFADDAARRDRLAAKGIRFVDVGVSGGPSGARWGACLLVGGTAEDFARMSLLWADLAVDGGYAHFEGTGAGHFVKMVHNGIEYGMMQAIAEGFTVLKSSPYSLDLSDAAAVYDRGSVIESRLVGWLDKALQMHGEELSDVSGTVGHTGEAEWMVDAARDAGIKARVIEEALAFRVATQEHPDWTGRVLSALREQFGKHSVDPRR
jgi:glucose-6-phosphate 1-dehydrogenase